MKGKRGRCFACSPSIYIPKAIKLLVFYYLRWATVCRFLNLRFIFCKIHSGFYYHFVGYFKYFGTNSLTCTTRDAFIIAFIKPYFRYCHKNFFELNSNKTMQAIHLFTYAILKIEARIFAGKHGKFN